MGKGKETVLCRTGIQHTQKGVAGPTKRSPQKKDMTYKLRQPS